MQLRDPESDEPVTAPLPPPPAEAMPCGIVALSDDPLLLEALSGAVTDGSRVSSSPSTDRFIDQLVANAAGIALIDAATVATPVKSFLATLREQFPQLLVLLTGPAQLQTQLGSQLADGTVFRFVHKPASSQRLRLFLDAAVRQLSDAATRPAPVAAVEKRRAPPAPPARRVGSLAIAGIAAAVLAAGIVGWWFWQHQPAAESPPPAAADQSAAPALALPTVETTQPTPSAPPPTPAPDAQSAHDGAARDAAAARETAAALEQAQRSAQGARADQLAVYLQLARKRLANGALIEPADDSARTYLDSALALAPEDPQVRATSLALGEALIGQFRHAVAEGDAIEAQRWLTACGNYHVSGTTLAQLNAQLQQLQQSQQAQPASQAPSSAPSSAPSPASITPAVAAATVPVEAGPGAAGAAVTAGPPAPGDGAAAAPAVVKESSLTRVQFVAPTYPEDALSRGISGWVDLEFTVSPVGKVTDITVTGAEPSNVFERAARSALMRSRYAPVVRNGVAVAQRAHVRIRFQP